MFLPTVKSVHKSPELDLVGWYTLVPRSGPIPDVLPIHSQILSQYNESAILLAFHPEDVLDNSGGKLPVTIYESNYEAEDGAGGKTTQSPQKKQQPQGAEDEDKEMKDGESATLKLKFRELPFSVETGEAEMISMDYVAGGAGNAAAKSREKTVATETDPTGKGKAKAKREAAGKEEGDDQSSAPEQALLSREEEELVSALTAKANAIKMLHARIQLIIKYLEQLPPSYVSGGGQGSQDATMTGNNNYTVPSNTILRSIQALVTRLALLDLSADEDFQKEMLSESNDVQLVSLLDDVIQSASEVRELGKKFAIVESGKASQRARNADLTGAPMAGSLSLTDDVLPSTKIGI